MAPNNRRVRWLSARAFCPQKPSSADGRARFARGELFLKSEVLEQKRPGLALFPVALMRCLEADDMLRSVPVVVVSTDGTESRLHQMLSLGARGYVKKPFMPETLREELERVLGGAYAG